MQLKDLLLLGSIQNFDLFKQTACNAIPPFNWPGSKMPPSPLESIFGGGAKEVAAPPAPPAPVKKASPFAAFGKKEAAPAPAAGMKTIHFYV
jgi:hypothetical protein